MNLAQLIIVAILTEAIWENCKMIWKKGKFSVNMFGALCLGIVICILARIDLFMIIGLELQVPIVGCILTGIIVARGANFVNDLFTKLQGGSK